MKSHIFVDGPPSSAQVALRSRWRPAVYRPTLGQKQPPPPGVCCQKDARGNTICSDGRGYPPG